ncbi:MAG: RNA methyltransferase [Anaerolineae bacterium]|jgi:RNA methyltransferase, TrmH family|nr:RNA methyltransferase [Anaerolineae bacterium]MBT7075816.1 RNA methyltransferase [Anaerolineae bacterium]MBT7783328.1 RNA methyltransferase [Anaerolineae bacterium]
MITSPQNPKLKLIRALQGRVKARRKEKAFLVEGVRLLEEAIDAKWDIRFILYDHSLSERGKKLINSLDDVEVEEIDSTLINSISDTENSQGIIAVLNDSQISIPDSPDFLLILDQIRDPGNLGTLLRTAAAAGVDAVILPPKTTNAFAPKVLRAGMGAHFHLPIISADWDEIKDRVRGLTVLLAEMEGGVNYTEASLKDACALIIGGEAEGASESARELAQTSIHIPMPGEMESLNAAVAGVILIFEVVRQRSRRIR